MINIYRFIGIFAVLLITLTSSAQEQVRYSQYMYNKYEFNPAFAGLSGALSITGQVRNQWSNLDLNPSSYLLNADIPLYNLNGAIGIVFENDKTGYTKNSKLCLSYNYIKSYNWGLISSGVRVGYRQLSIDGSKIITPEGNYDNTIEHNDPILPNSPYSGNGLIWDAGFVFANRDMELGISVSNLFLNKLSNKLYITQSNKDFQLFLQYNYRSIKGFVIKPIVLLKSDMKQLDVDISTVIDYYGKIFAGISLQLNNKIKIDALIITMGTKITSNFKVYYSYDIDFTTLRTLHDGTHEIVLNYNLNKIFGKKGILPIIYSPRNL